MVYSVGATVRVTDTTLPSSSSLASLRASSTGATLARKSRPTDPSTTRSSRLSMLRRMPNLLLRRYRLAGRRVAFGRPYAQRQQYSHGPDGHDPGGRPSRCGGGTATPRGAGG